VKPTVKNKKLQNRESRFEYFDQTSDGIPQPEAMTEYPQPPAGGVLNVDIDGNNAFQIKAIGVVISTFETLPGMEPLWDWEGRRPLG
jgi:hypothetical protein